MDTAAWEPVLTAIDDETSEVYVYCAPYRDGNFYIVSYYSVYNEWTLYYSKIDDFEYDDLILKRGFKTVSSAKRYFTKNLSFLLDKVDLIMYGDDYV